jgi:hypothetical protein
MVEAASVGEGDTAVLTGAAAVAAPVAVAVAAGAAALFGAPPPTRAAIVVPPQHNMRTVPKIARITGSWDCFARGS